MRAELLSQLKLCSMKRFVPGVEILRAWGRYFMLSVADRNCNKKHECYEQPTCNGRKDFLYLNAMKKRIGILLLSLYSSIALAQMKHRIYLIPGQGADERLFSELKLDNCELNVLKFLVPGKDELLPEYAKRMSEQIDTAQSFSIVGVSLGGMIAVEMSKFLPAEKIVIISSAKGREELPVRYRMMKYVPLYKMFPGVLLKRMANIARPIVEPESKAKTPVFKAMIDAKDPQFMQRSIHMIVNWDNKQAPANLVHIHGTKDKTLPIRYIDNKAIKVKGGGHMVTLVRSGEISKLLNEIFAQQ